MMAPRRCPLCSAGAWTFAPLPESYAAEWRRWGFPYEAHDFETLNHRAYACRACGATDRDRMCAVWIERRQDARGSLLDIGPSRPLQAFLRARFDYLSVDAAHEADVPADVQDLPFADASFDHVLCSHVLEHVADDRRALR